MADPSGKFIEINGALMEGGGQVLRNTTSLSAILSKPIKVANIRANRAPKPGLRAQHLTGLQVVANLYSGDLRGGNVNSTEITFKPGVGKSGKFVADIGTAGSICLLMQISLPCMLFSSGKVEYIFKGGTNADKCPSIDYFTQVFTPLASHFGISYEVKCVKRGFYPKGGGEVHLITSPIASLKPITLETRGEVTHVEIHAFTAGALPGNNYGERMVAEAEKHLKKYFNSGSIQFSTKFTKETNQTAVGTGAGILLLAKTNKGCTIAGSALLEKNRKPDELGASAAKELIENVEHGGVVDEHAADQIIIFMALAKGKSSVVMGPLSLHTQTSIHFSQLMTGAKFQVTEVPTEHGKKLFHVICEGIGFENKYI